MAGVLLLYFASLLAVAGSIAPAAAVQPRYDADESLYNWRAASDRTSSVKTCPSSCRDDTGNLESWFLFDDVASLAACNETMLLRFSIQETTPDSDQVLATAIRGCKADYTFVSAENNSAMADDNVAAVCSTPNHDIVQAVATIGKPFGNTADEHDSNLAGGSILSAGYQVRNYLSLKAPSCTENVIVFGYSRSAIFGLFAGVEVYQHGVHADILNHFLQDLEAKDTSSKPLIAQLCSVNGFGADYAVGIVAASVDDLALVRDVMQSWADGTCVSGDLEDYMTTSVRVPAKLGGPSNGNSSSTFNLTSASPAELSKKDAKIWTRSGLISRATCKTTTVHSGDGCDAVAARCGISTADLQKYNTAKNFCSTLVPDQVVCCSSGTLPDPIPPANSDGTCKTKSVISGDSCSSLASKCGLKPADFTKLHPASNFCSALQVGQPVCCTYGKLPDITPKPGSDGSCAVYSVKSGDGCSVIAVSHGLTEDKIESFNTKTWGWNGCSALLPAQNICLSTGTPPFPPSVSNAVCGPQVPGTKKPSSGSSDTWASLNPCPLKVCCNVWGQCGATDDFCVKSPADTGAPGTTKPGKNSCKSPQADIIL